MIEETKNRIIEMAWEDRTPFDAIKDQFGISEKDVILEPLVDVTYEEIVNVMDAIRYLKKSDPSLFRKEGGVDVKVKELFSKIVFGNIQS